MAQPTNEDKPEPSAKGCSKVASGCLIAVALGAVGFVLLLASTAGPFRSVDGKGVAADEANRKLWTNFVPVSATDVWFESAYFSTRIDCELDAEEFHAWCQRRGWRPTAIVGDAPRGIYSDRLGSIVWIESGFEFTATTGSAGRGNSGVHDAKSGRAYVFYAGR